MSILKFPSKQPDSPFFNEIVEEGYHVFSLKNAVVPGYYPNEFPAYPGVRIRDLKVDDMFTVRFFFVLVSVQISVRTAGISIWKFVYWRYLSDGTVGIVTILHERMHQIEHFKDV